MGLETTMMRQWMGHKGPEDVTQMMQEMMPLMMEKMGPEGTVELISGLMPSVMPSMIEGSFQKPHPSDTTQVRRYIMPNAMHACFSNMEPEQRSEIISMCRWVLDQIENQYIEKGKI